MQIKTAKQILINIKVFLSRHHKNKNNQTIENKHKLLKTKPNLKSRWKNMLIPPKKKEKEYVNPCTPPLRRTIFFLFFYFLFYLNAKEYTARRK